MLQTWRWTVYQIRLTITGISLINYWRSTFSASPHLRARWRYPDCRIKIRMVPNGINGFLNFHPLLLFPLSSFPTHTHLTLLIYLFKRIVSSLMRETRETSCHNWVKDSKFGGSPMIKKKFAHSTKWIVVHVTSLVANSCDNVRLREDYT